jgi:hypothetical protein
MEMKKERKKERKKDWCFSMAGTGDKTLEYGHVLRIISN